MHRQTPQHEPWLGRNLLCDRHDLVEGDPELGGLFTSLGVRMTVDRDVRVDPNPNSSSRLDLVRHRNERRELARRLDIDEPDAGANRILDLDLGLADAREHDAVRIEPRDPRPAQLANRHDVGARTELPEDTEHAEVAVGFDGVADAVADAVQCVVERVVLRANQVGTVDVGRRPDAIRDCLEQSRIEP